MLTRLRRLAGNEHKAELLRAVRGGWARSRTDAGASIRLEEHLHATYRWLCAAQDAGDEGGVAGWFDLLAGRWSPPYPETTGYIIPTFLAVAEAYSDPSARERALRMADWEADIQMQDGAVLSGVLGTPRGPAVFNTGQAILGWVAAFEATGNERYASAARAASEWLVRHQDEDGAWRERLSMMTSAPVHSYNDRCAWALAYAANVLDEERFMQSARRSCDWVLTQQNDVGWFANTGFAEGDVPLLHTISYVIEGLLGVYTFTDERRYLDGARGALDQVLARYRQGRIAGRLDSRWEGTVSWRCVTGDAQIAVVLHRLARHCPGNGYAEAARDLIEDVAKMQIRIAGTPSGFSQATDVNGSSGPTRPTSPVVGAVPGSFPIWGKYMRFAFPNWAAKFFLDALLLEVAGVDEASFRALPTSEDKPQPAENSRAG